MIDLERECSQLPLRTFQDGELVIEEGARSGALYFLKQGRLKVRRGGVEIVEISEPGAILGEISILLDRPHIAEVVASGEAILHVAADADGFLRSHPEVNLSIARSLAKKVDTMNCYLTDLKQQYAGEDNQLGMVHEVLDAMMQAKS